MGVCKDFKVGILSGEESWALFKKKVENFGDTDEYLAKLVCEECQGLPVAIIALGATLKGKDVDAWQDALYKLQNSMLKDIEGINSRVYASLRWSFDRLDSEDAKSCFLLCCLFPEDGWISVYELLTYCMVDKSYHHDPKPDSFERALYQVRTVLGTLKSCCLLLDEKHYCHPELFVKMHDVVRDVAISIAKAEKSFLVKHGFTHWPEKASYGHCSVMSLRPKDMREFPEELGYPELHTLRLDCRVNEFQLQVPDRFFNGMQNLTTLFLINVTMSPVLPASLAKLAKLQTLSLQRCGLEDIAIIKDLKDHLEILCLDDSNIKALPPEVGELTRLRYLAMDRCTNLEVIPAGVISKLCRLEELYLPSTFGQWEGSTSGTERDISVVRLDELMSLTRLTTLNIFIPDAALLPEHFTFENLVTFRISVGQKDYVHNDYYMGALKLKNIHSDINWEGLLEKPKQRMQRSGLYRSKSFCHLGSLSITDSKLKYLFSPSSAKGLVRLKKLEIEQCVDMEGVIGNEGEEDENIKISFSRLNQLQLEDLPKLISFYPEKERTKASSGSSAHARMSIFTDKVAFPVLESLYIASVPKVTKIWYKQKIRIPGNEIVESSFNQLQSLEIRHCDKLVNVVGGCSNEEVTFWSETQKGRENDECVTQFPKLTILRLEDLLNLESLCSHSIRCEAQSLFDHQVAFPALETLYIASVPKVTKIWYKQNIRIPGNKLAESSFNQLQSMEICRCDKLVNVIGGCSNEVVIFLSETQKRREDDDCVDVTQFRKLRILKLEDLSNLESLCSRSDRCEAQPLFDHQVAFPALETLYIASVPKVTKIWYKQNFRIPGNDIAESSFNQLQSIEICGCDKLVNVLGGCSNEVVIQKGREDDHCVAQFRKLRILKLKDLSNLESLCSRSNRCEAQPLFDHQVAFPALETLYIASMPKVTKIWYKQNFRIPGNEIVGPSFNQLQSLEIYRCDKLVNVVGGCLNEGVTFLLETQKGREDGHCVTQFPKLRILKLEDLSNLDGLCSRSVRCKAQPLFDHQVVFPVLETLYIASVPKVTKIWYKKNFRIPGNEIVESCFNQLQSMEIRCCDELVNVVGGCSNEEVIFLSETQKGGEDDHCVTRFPKLTILKLEDLSSLKSLCSRSIRCEAQPLFDHQVAFPALKDLKISKLPHVRNIWDKELGAAKSFPKNALHVYGCSELVNVVQSTMLPQLRTLKQLSLESCPMVEAIVDLDKREQQTGKATNSTVVPFPELKYLTLRDLQNIKGFCTFRSEEQHVFHAQAAFPKLKQLTFYKMGERAFWQLMGACKLNSKTRLSLLECDEISTVLLPHLFRRLRNMGLLNVESCAKVTEVFHFDGLKVGEGQECIGPLAQVRMIQLQTLPQLTCLWNKYPNGLMALQNLEYLTVKKCPLLRNLLTSSIAKALGGLKVLYLMSCSMMEEVIAEEAHGDVIEGHEIAFPKLEWLILKDLPNLKSFCSGNINFYLPSLQKVVFKKCPNMQTFTFGSVSMQRMSFITRADDGLVIEDLNKHIQQLHLKGEEIVEATSAEMWGNEEQFSYLHSNFGGW